MEDCFQPLLLASLVSATIGCCCTSGDISTDDGDVLLEGEAQNMGNAPESIAPEPSTP